jgi:hypothetical protein
VVQISWDDLRVHLAFTSVVVAVRVSMNMAVSNDSPLPAGLNTSELNEWSTIVPTHAPLAFDVAGQTGYLPRI